MTAAPAHGRATRRRLASPLNRGTRRYSLDAVVMLRGDRIRVRWI
jgi:hypothetical protein